MNNIRNSTGLARTTLHFLPWQPHTWAFTCNPNYFTVVILQIDRFCLNFPQFLHLLRGSVPSSLDNFTANSFSLPASLTSTIMSRLRIPRDPIEDQPRSKLLNLPLEIKRQIYGKIMKSSGQKALSFIHQAPTYKEHGMNARTSTQRAILVTCKRVYIEAIEMYYSNTIVVCSADQLAMVVRPKTEPYLPLLEHLVLRYPTPPSHVSFSIGPTMTQAGQYTPINVSLLILQSFLKLKRVGLDVGALQHSTLQVPLHDIFKTTTSKITKALEQEIPTIFTYANRLRECRPTLQIRLLATTTVSRAMRSIFDYVEAMGDRIDSARDSAGGYTPQRSRNRFHRISLAGIMFKMYDEDYTNLYRLDFAIGRVEKSIMRTFQSDLRKIEQKLGQKNYQDRIEKGEDIETAWKTLSEVPKEKAKNMERDGEEKWEPNALV
jgi:hypothetical protein